MKKNDIENVHKVALNNPYSDSLFIFIMINIYTVINKN